MFRGLSSVNLDDKGRFAMPMRYREAMCGGDGKGVIVITVDTASPCLLMYPLGNWEEIESRIQKLPSFDEDVRRAQRLLVGHATEIEMDSSGRLLVPGLLREYANFKKTISLVGQLNKFEIWSEEQWSSSRKDWITSTNDKGRQDSELLRHLSI